ncbi:hypothetical protein [Micromonospora sp. NPDC023814]|uniref:hypothetical protein n=1 Tax=Micromonospora sp. NPDC023814 TaxID=3154596 RepID=UPI0033C74D32
MDLRSRRAASTRVVGTTALLSGLLISVLTISGDSGMTEPHFLAGLLVLTGIGLRLEAAITAPRA